MAAMASTRSIVEFLSLVEIGVVRRSADGSRIETRRPGSILFESGDDLGLGDAAREATTHGWVLVSHGTVDGTWMLTASGAQMLAQLRPRPMGPPAGHPAGSGAASATPVVRAVGRLTFTPHAHGPSWMLDITDLDAEALFTDLSTPQRAELRVLLDTISERLSRYA